MQRRTKPSWVGKAMKGCRSMELVLGYLFCEPGRKRENTRIVHQRVLTPQTAPALTSVWVYQVPLLKMNLHPNQLQHHLRSLPRLCRPLRQLRLHPLRLHPHRLPPPSLRNMTSCQHRHLQMTHHRQHLARRRQPLARLVRNVQGRLRQHRLRQHRHNAKTDPTLMMTTCSMV